jgi:hypothetical protein
MLRGFLKPFCLLCLLFFTLTGCDSFTRAGDAAAARRKMVGMGKEQVLACMGVPGKRAQAGATEVWSYTSTNGLGEAGGLSQRFKQYGMTLGESAHERYFCTVNIVMTNGVVSVVHYNGPRGGSFDPDEQCGYAVEHCAEGD